MATEGDGFSILQKRIWELQTFNVLLVGEPGYIDPSSVYLAVDNVTWSEAKKISLVEFVANLHKEQGPVEINSVNVSEVYGTPFNSIGYYLRIDAWRTITIDGVSYIENIPIKNFVRTVNGFTFELSSYQAGDVIDYLAFE